MFTSWGLEREKTSALLLTDHDFRSQQCPSYSWPTAIRAILAMFLRGWDVTLLPLSIIAALANHRWLWACVCDFPLSMCCFNSVTYQQKYSNNSKRCSWLTSQSMLAFLLQDGSMLMMSWSVGRNWQKKKMVNRKHFVKRHAVNVSSIRVYSDLSTVSLRLPNWTDSVYILKSGPVYYKPTLNYNVILINDWWL